jgi:hypothetical protein
LRMLCVIHINMNFSHYVKITSARSHSILLFLEAGNILPATVREWNDRKSRFFGAMAVEFALQFS